jgi:MoaA/NifB/PqqE/SkfB family radical SAM enzyme
MSLIYKRYFRQSGLSAFLTDYSGELSPFIKRIDKKRLIIPLMFLKTIEWSIYRWYKTPVRRFYGVKGNELIYMITKRCNERCAKCGIWKNPEQDNERLTVSDFLKCLNFLQHNIYQVTLTGGEPLLFIEDILIIAEESYKLGVPMMIVTNGSLLSDVFLKKYAGHGHALVVSLDTIDPGKWVSFRGRDNFKQVMDNVSLAHKILGSKLSIQSVLAEETVADIPKVKSFCDELCIQHIIQPYMDFGGFWHNASFNSGLNSENRGANACAARKNICIYPNGDVVKCFDHHRIALAKEPLGNISKEDIIPILCKKRSIVISKLMKTCDYPCKRLSCNKPVFQYIL